ncbi:hypothetical protein [Crenothrix sp.]|uniref:hypothetical protein n=1 Tax=Crenothrix sp. TaxID=3100433 RepID=UPI00374D8C26
MSTTKVQARTVLSRKLLKISGYILQCLSSYLLDLNPTEYTEAQAKSNLETKNALLMAFCPFTNLAESF